MKNFGEQFLHKNDQKLHTSQPVKYEKKRKERVGEKTSEKPADKISDWLKVIEKTHMGHSEIPEVLERIKEYYHKEYVVKAEDISESTFIFEQKIARAQGHGNIEITDDFKKQKIQEIIGNQEKSLDKWVDYLSSSDAMYPMWAKYWAFNSMLKMGRLEKKEDKETRAETAKFIPREKDTTASFPPLNPRALAMTIGAIQAKAEENIKGKKERKGVENTSVKLNEEDFKNLLNTESFSRIYTQFLIEMPEYSKEGLRETRGKWVKYEKGSEPNELVKSLEGYPLEWCTANTDTAGTQLQGGDFHVYYSINEKNEAKIPRVAIRMQENQIAEVRGIAPGQNIDPYIGDVIKEKMNDFPDGEIYKKKGDDMKRLTEIEEKNNLKQKLSKEELRFLYQVDSTIDSFGSGVDPRIKEIYESRKEYVKEDISVVLSFTVENIAFGLNEIKENTKVYVGDWNFEIAKKIPQHIEYLYESFPEKKILRKTIELTTKSGEEYEKELTKEGYAIGDSANYMLKKIEPLQKSKKIDLISFSVSQLGLTNRTALSEIYAKAKELGLELCPSQVGPELRLNYKDQSIEFLRIAMEPILEYDEQWSFQVSHINGKRRLGNSGGSPDRKCESNDCFVFLR